MISANSTSQHRICTSAPEAELNEIFRTSKKLLHYKGLLRDLGEQKITMAILSDSSTSLRTIANPISTRYKFISIQIHYLKQLIQQPQFKVVYIPREKNLADLMTKQNVPREFHRLWSLAYTPFRWNHQQLDAHVSRKDQQASRKGPGSQIKR